MVEGLVVVLILSFITLIVGITQKMSLIIINQIATIIIIIYFLIRVRVKISRAEKEKLRKKIEELEEKIASFKK